VIQSVLGLAVGLFLLAANSVAHAGPAGSVTIEAEGLAPFLLDMSLDEVRGRARDQARRNAIEQAVGVFVRGASTLKNSQITDDLVSTIARGVIEREEWLDEHIEQVAKDNGHGAAMALYHATVKADVRHVHVEHRADFELQARLNKEVFQQGEEAVLKIRSTQEAYLYLFSVTYDGSVTVLLPNRYAPRHAVTAEEDFQFPSDTMRTLGIRLRVELQPGSRRAVEHIKVIATKRPIELVKIDREEPRDGFQTFAGGETGMIQDVMKRLALLDDTEWTEATVPYEIRR